MEQRINSNIMEPFNPRPMAEYVTKVLAAENYHALVAATQGYEAMRWPQPDYHQSDIAFYSPHYLLGDLEEESKTWI